MKLYRTDASVHQIQVGDRRYPVRDGVFMVPDSTDPELLPGFEETGAAQATVEELRRLGSVALDGEGGESPVEGEAQLREAFEALAEAAQKIDALEEKIEELEAEIARRDAADGGEPEETGGPTLAERIDAVDSHAAANALAKELGVEGFSDKKPGVDAKKKALHAKAAEIAAAEPQQ